MKYMQAMAQVALSGDSWTDSDDAKTNLEAQDNGIVIEGTDGLIRFANQTFVDMTQEMPEKIINSPISDFLSAGSDQTDKENEIYTLKTNKDVATVLVTRTDLWLGELHVGALNIVQKHNNGTKRSMDNNAELMYRNRALEKEVLLMKMNDEGIPRFLQRDYLTKLPNKNLFLERLTNEIRIARRFNYQVAVCYVDIDDLKVVNERYGYYCGDKVIKETARRIREIAGEDESLARMDGDEFAIILTDVKDVKKLEDFARKIQKSISREIIIKGQTIRISCSMGISIYPSHSRWPCILLKKAKSGAEQMAGKSTGFVNMNDAFATTDSRDSVATEMKCGGEEMYSTAYNEIDESKDTSSEYTARLALLHNRKMTVPELSSIIDMKNEPLIAFDLCGNIITANTSFSEHFSLDNDLIIGKRILDIEGLSEKSAKEIESYIQLIKNTMSNEKGSRSGLKCKLRGDRNICKTDTGENACEFHNTPSYIVAVLRPV